MRRLLIVDEDERVVTEYRQSIEAQARHDWDVKRDGALVVDACTSPARALEMLRAGGFALAVIPLRLSQPFDYDFLAACRAADATLQILVVTTMSLYGPVPRLMYGRGADVILKRPLAEGRLYGEVVRALTGPDPAIVRLFRDAVGIVGESPEWLRMLQWLMDVIRSDSTIVLEGETGTGKELLAKAVHKLHPNRQAHPWLPVNVSALPAALVDTALFGHVRGAYTGTEADRLGAFERVGEGTLFLDEIGDLTEEVQIKLLRVIQEREFTRVGCNVPRQFGGRLVFATLRDLTRKVEEGTFREDLYHRIAQNVIKVPPLRDRTGDVRMMMRQFLDQRRGTREVDFGPEVLELLESHSCPGNVRELMNYIEQGACAARDGGSPSRMSTGAPSPSSARTAPPRRRRTGRPSRFAARAPGSTWSTRTRSPTSPSSSTASICRASSPGRTTS